MIWFNLSAPRAYLIIHGFVYTLRGAFRKTGIHAAVCKRNGQMEMIGDVQVERTMDIVKWPGHKIRPYVKNSGLLRKADFEGDASKRWFELGLKLHRGKPMALYKVTLLRGKNQNIRLPALSALENRRR